MSFNNDTDQQKSVSLLASTLRHPLSPRQRMLIKWESSFETGLRQIDLQHQELIDLLNQTAAAHAQGEDKTLIDKLLPAMHAYILFHFGTEESLLRNTGIDPEHVRLHYQAHRLFGERLEAIQQEAARSSPKALDGLLDYLKEWLVEHITKIDRELGRQVLAQQNGALH